jgi:FMN-dependent oxidoreductase (nitrilotriacetate monooxygenase family)
MSDRKRQMHLGVFVLGTGNHSAGWRWEGAYTSSCSFPVMKSIASIAERGKFDLFFISDALMMDPGDHPSFANRFEPLTLLSALSSVTTHVGLGATVSTSFGEPYHVARAFASLDHLSNGRAGWNVVTSTHEKAALNFSKSNLPEHDLRYEIASEFVDVVRGLWDSWEDGAVIADRATGVFLDKSKIRPLDHKGRFFSVKGPLNIERSPQGHPVIIQAGASGRGQRFAGRWGEVIFAAHRTTALAKEAYGAVKDEAARLGRNPEHVSICNILTPVAGATKAEAEDKMATISKLPLEIDALSLLAEGLNYDFAAKGIDEPFTDGELAGMTGFIGMRDNVIKRSGKKNPSARDFIAYSGRGYVESAIVGGPKEIADVMEEMFAARGCDGFVVAATYVPGGYADFVRHVVPELQRRGLYHLDYAGNTLRENLGLPRPPVGAWKLPGARAAAE